jgi:hypothetical protein
MSMMRSLFVFLLLLLVIILQRRRLLSLRHTLIHTLRCVLGMS